MATGAKYVSILKGTILSTITFSGTVKLSSVGVARDIIVYNLTNHLVPYTTSSDGAGDWTIDVPGGTNDRFRIICVGEDGENSEIYEHLAG